MISKLWLIPVIFGVIILFLTVILGIILSNYHVLFWAGIIFGVVLILIGLVIYFVEKHKDRKKNVLTPVVASNMINQQINKPVNDYELVNKSKLVDVDPFKSRSNDVLITPETSYMDPIDESPILV